MFGGRSARFATLLSSLKSYDPCTAFDFEQKWTVLMAVGKYTSRCHTLLTVIEMLSVGRNRCAVYVRQFVRDMKLIPSQKNSPKCHLTLLKNAMYAVKKP